jgi:Tfp pilus assembly protein PilF/thiol-disulfide isomerase/thioredoxin
MNSRVSPAILKNGFIAAFFILAMALGTASAAFKYIQEGMTPPDLEGKDLVTGKEVVWKPGEAGEGSEVTLILFWASWSPRSLELLRDMKDVAGQYEDKGFRVIAVNVDGQDPSPMVLQEITRTTVELDLPFPVVVDEGLKIFYAYGVIAVPSLALIDGSGELRYGPSGYSYVVRDRIVDSTEVLLGLRDAGELAVLTQGYKPKPKASRYYRLGQRLASQDLYERALENLDVAVMEDEGFSSPHNLKGQIQLALGKWDAAAGNFARAVDIDSTLVAAWAGWGRSLLHQDLNEEAADRLTRALDLDNTYTPALVDLAECRIREGKSDEAWVLFQSARELNPRDPELLFSMGKFLEGKGEYTSAVFIYRTAVEQLVTLPIIKEKTDP